MKRDREDDAAIGRMLRAGLGLPAAEGDACPQASDLAAFVEGGLSKAEREAIERHAAACPRCHHSLALIGSMASSAPAMPAWSAWLPAARLRWAIPATVVALGVLLYVAVGPAIRPQAPATVTRLASKTAVAQEPRADRSLVAENLPAPVAPPSTPVAGKPVETATRGARVEAPRERARKKVPTAAPVPAPRLDAVEEIVVPQVAARQAPAQQALVQQAPAQQPPAQQAQAQRNVLDRTQRIPGGVAGGVVGGVPEPPPPKAIVSGQISVAETVQIAAPSTAGKPTLTIVAAPGRSVLWRLDANGAISRSRDGGLTWNAQPHPMTSQLLAGSAPTSTVCWLVGRGGVVLLTVDADRWQQRPFPERIDLVGVDARDSLNATVTARDGRRFVTDDGGATWR